MADEPYRDDASLADELELWRRIPPWHVHHDPNLQRLRPASSAFDDDPDGAPMSVVLADGRVTAEAVLTGHPGYGLAGFTVGLARACQLGVARSPEPGNVAHALVTGAKTARVRRLLAKECRWIVPPPAAS